MHARAPTKQILQDMQLYYTYNLVVKQKNLTTQYSSAKQAVSSF